MYNLNAVADPVFVISIFVCVCAAENIQQQIKSGNKKKNAHKFRGVRSI